MTYYKNRSFKKAVILHACGKKLDTLEPSIKGKDFIFVFEDRFSCEEILNQFINNELSLNPNKIFNSWDILKELIH